MRFVKCSTGLALYALLFATCETPSSSCDPSLTSGSAPCQSLMCPGSLADCKNGATDGCETDTASEIDNCGGCGIKCPIPANGEASCIAGVCGVSTCGTRYKDCNTSSTDGCEVDTFRDAGNCGACGNVCQGGSNAVGVCILGKCQLACQAAYLDCNSDPADGCETNGSTDLANCGNCGNTCTAVGATTPACAAGSCITTMCTGANRTCKAGPIDSCEIDSAKDVANCGTCGKQCAAVNNGTPGCTASNCGIGSCNTNFKDCDGMLATGCEINITTDVKHCSACGMACPNLANASAGCTASTCGLGSCNAGFADCDNNPATGCEINTSNDVNHCGMCGKACAAGLVCASGSCVLQYRPTGPQTGVPVATVTSGGWTQCYLDTYNLKLPVASLLAGCTKANLMLACRPTASTTLQLLAWAPRVDVIFDTGTGNTPHNATGSGWYFNATYSWGFALQGDPLSRGECDTAGTNSSLRLCWHTVANAGGYRCGSNTGLNGSTAYERLVYQAD